jgi:hypothetical protein
VPNDETAPETHVYRTLKAAAICFLIKRVFHSTENSTRTTTWEKFGKRGSQTSIGGLCPSYYHISDEAMWDFSPSDMFVCSKNERYNTTRHFAHGKRQQLEQNEKPSCLSRFNAIAVTSAPSSLSSSLTVGRIKSFYLTGQNPMVVWL